MPPPDVVESVLRRLVSISGETTAPLPHGTGARHAGTAQDFNLRRDHRSLATTHRERARRPLHPISISGETTAPLPQRERRGRNKGNKNFNLRRDHRSLATKLNACAFADNVAFQSQARPPLPCHSNEWTRNGGAHQVSISGETTAPLPQAFYTTVALLKLNNTHPKREKTLQALFSDMWHSVLVKYETECCMKEKRT